MMKSLFKYIILSIVAFISVSCMESLEREELEGGPYIKIDCACLNDVLINSQTKATADGVAADNENLIKSIDYFFYRKGVTANKAILKGHVTPNVQGSYQFNVSLNDGQLENLFPSPERQCDLFVVVNWPTDLSQESNTSYDMLKTLVHEADFAGQNVQDCFIMTGHSTVSISSRNRTLAATADVSLSRLAARIVVGVSTVKQYLEEVKDTEGNPTGEKVLWTSHPERMGIVFYNAGKKANLGDDPSAIKGDAAFHFNYGTYTDSEFKSSRTFTDTGSRESSLDESYSNRFVCPRFYTYPDRWHSGDKDEPYLVIQMAWSHTDISGEHYKYFYYKVILSAEGFRMNTWYNLNVHLSILGSLSPNRPVITSPDDLTYGVADWRNCLVGGKEPGEEGTDHNVEAEIRDVRYLMVENTRYTMYNQSSIVIPFSSSHPVVLAGRSYSSLKPTIVWNPVWSTSQLPIATREDFRNGGYIDSATSGGFSYSLDNSRKELTIRHILENDTKQTSYDYSPYTVIFRLQHEDKADVYEEITVVQYPALYIQAQPNSVPDTKGGAFILNNQTENASYGGIHGLTGSNTNPDMYVISTSVLPSTSPYILAEPRLPDPDNLGLATNANRFPSVQGETRQLTYYYPTGEDGYENIIAPKFRIASSYGVTSQISYADAQRRCAAYQEDKYPAGRWRVPTKAEVMYMCQLSTDKVIKRLFGSDSGTGTSVYWCSGGTVTVANGTNTADPVFSNSKTGNNSVRCVYDEWYWENTTTHRLSSNIYTWGDQQR